MRLAVELQKLATSSIFFWKKILNCLLLSCFSGLNYWFGGDFNNRVSVQFMYIIIEGLFFSAAYFQVQIWIIAAYVDYGSPMQLLRQPWELAGGDLVCLEPWSSIQFHTIYIAVSQWLGYSCFNLNTSLLLCCYGDDVLHRNRSCSSHFQCADKKEQQSCRLVKVSTDCASAKGLFLPFGKWL